MNQLLFATANQHKLQEIRKIAGKGLVILGLDKFGFTEEIPETHDTLEENSAEKARFVFDRLHIPCFAEDTGLEIDSLNGKPGVNSARYAGSAKNAMDNIEKVLKEMEGKTGRQARFRAVITLIDHLKIYQFEGILSGAITQSVHGTSGFGYDPIFRPKGYNMTLAEMAESMKNKISHRYIAFQRMLKFVNENKTEIGF